MNGDHIAAYNENVAGATAASETLYFTAYNENAVGATETLYFFIKAPGGSHGGVLNNNVIVNLPLRHFFKFKL